MYAVAVENTDSLTSCAVKQVVFPTTLHKYLMFDGAVFSLVNYNMQLWLVNASLGGAHYCKVN